MERLETELERARDLDVAALAESIESIGFECTRCGACCKGYTPEPEGHGDGDDGDERDAEPGSEFEPEPDPEPEPHTATVFPDEVRTLIDATSDATSEIEDGPYDWRDVARPMPYGLETAADGTQTGETFEWALQTDSCGDCTFYRESDGEGACTVHDDRPLICRTYPFSVGLAGTSQPMGEAVDEAGLLRAHECEGLGRPIERSEAIELASTLKRRTVREIEEAIAVRESYDPHVGRTRGNNDVEDDHAGNLDVVVHDSEGAKRIDGVSISDPES